MFGMDNRCGSPFGGKWAARRGWRGHFGPGGGRSGRHGMGDDNVLRARRMLAQGDLRLLALALIAEQPRHGYEIIKILEDKTEGWYSPSPGIVYPTLTYLEEAGYVAAQVEGAKKLYTITDEGRAHLAENRDFVDAVLDRLTAVGEKISRMRRRHRDDSLRDDETLPRAISGALLDLNEAVRELLHEDRSGQLRAIEIIDRAIQEIRVKRNPS